MILHAVRAVDPTFTIKLMRLYADVTQLYITGCNIDILPTDAYYVTQSFLPLVEFDYAGGLSSDHFWQPAPLNDSTLSLVCI